MDRRNFIRNTGLAIGVAAVFPGCTPGPEGAAEQTETLSYDTWENIRRQFLFTPGRIHMSQMLLAAHPKQVRKAIEAHRKGFDENPVEYWENNWMTKDNEMRKAAAAYLDADPSEIVLTDSTTMGLGILYSGLKLNAGDEILTTTLDHYSTEKALAFAAAKSGAILTRVAVYENAVSVTADEMVNVLKRGITPKTRIVAITWVHSCTGVKLPVKEISTMISEVNKGRDESHRIYLCVDGVHGFGIENVSMKDLGCDFFAAGTHKWIFGPRGTGILWGKKDAWRVIAPIIPSFEYNSYGAWLDLVPDEKLTFADMCSPGGFHSFEHRWALGEAFDFQLRIGKARVEERTHGLSSLLKEGLSSISHIATVTPTSPSLSAGINCFEVKGLKPDDAVKRLLTKNIIASSSPYKTSYVRLTPSIVNSEEEVMTCVRELEMILN